MWCGSEDDARLNGDERPHTAEDLGQAFQRIAVTQRESNKGQEVQPAGGGWRDDVQRGCLVTVIGA